MKKGIISRRTMLRGMVAGVGATLALPPLEAMFDGNGTAYADGTPIPLRYGTFFWGNGVRPDRWIPLREGAEWWRDPSEELAPIAASTLVRDQVSVLTNFECKQGGTAHHTGRAQILTGTYDQSKGTYGEPTGPSSDYLVASAWEGLTPIRSMDVGISRVGKSGSYARGAVSWGTGGTRINSEFSTSTLFERLFGMGVDVDAEVAARVATVRGAMVDVVREDAARLRRRLGTNDRRRLDQHLEGLLSIERAIEGFDVSGCALPEHPADGHSEDRGHELLEEKMRVMAELIAMGLACDLTRVFTCEFTGMQSDCIFWQVGAEQGSHVMTHDDRGVPDSERLDPQYENVHRAVVFIMQNFTHLLEAMARIPEGDGTLLSNSVVYATSELSDGTRHSYDDMPILVAGRAGGRLRGGVHYRSATDENASMVPLTCMRAVGVAADGFGAGASRATDEVGALLT